MPITSYLDPSKFQHISRFGKPWGRHASASKRMKHLLQRWGSWSYGSLWSDFLKKDGWYPSPWLELLILLWFSVWCFLIEMESIISNDVFVIFGLCVVYVPCKTNNIKNPLPHMTFRKLTNKSQLAKFEACCLGCAERGWKVAFANLFLLEQ